MPSDQQTDLFKRLVSERDFPAGTDTQALLSQFPSLNTASASAWIEKALSLPEKDKVPPPF